MKIFKKLSKFISFLRINKITHKSDMDEYLSLSLLLYPNTREQNTGTFLAVSPRTENTFKK
jgi:hypothetical protein